MNQKPKNARCSCGSGRKTKFCCGTAPKPERTAVLMPLRDGISLPTQRCLQKFNDGDLLFLAERGLPVEQARNRLVERVLALPQHSRPRYVIWADSDAVWQAGTFDRLRSHVRRLGPRALIGVLHGPRAVGAHPAVLTAVHPPQGTPLQWGVDYPKEPSDETALMRVMFAGSHMYAHDVRLLESLGEHPWTPRPTECSEDLAFTNRVHRIGGEVWCDTSLPVLHYDERRGYAFTPGHFGPFTIAEDGRPEAAPGDPETWERLGLRVAEDRSYGPLIDEHRLRSKTRAA